MNIKNGAAHKNGEYLVISSDIELDKINAASKNILDDLGLTAAKKKLIAALNKKIDDQNKTLKEISKCSAILFEDAKLTYEDYRENPALTGDVVGYMKASRKKLATPLYTDAAVSAAVVEFADAAIPVLKNEEVLLDRAIKKSAESVVAAQQALDEAKRAYNEQLANRTAFYDQVTKATSRMIEAVEKTPGMFSPEVPLAPYTRDPIEYLEKAKQNAAAGGNVAEPCIYRRNDISTYNYIHN